MKEICIFLADGFEEVEALTTVDLLRRAGGNVHMVSVTDNLCVHGAHGIDIVADCLFDEVNNDPDMLILPGGMPGTIHLKEHKGLTSFLKSQFEAGRYIAAICAAPTVLGYLGFLNRKQACCHPGMEDGLTDADVTFNPVSVDGTIITSRGLGTAIPFALTLIEILFGAEKSKEIKTAIVY